jgi:hypothetical protein
MFGTLARAYSHGAKADVQREALVAKVNQITIYEDLDHTVCATELRKAVEAGEDMELQLCFPPS